MRRSIVLLVVLGMAAVSNAAWVALDNFESYADSAALNAVWKVKTDGGASAVTLTLENDGDQYMKCYTTGVPSGYGQVQYIFSDAVWNNHGVNLTYLGITDMKFDHKVTDKACAYLQVTLYDCWGMKVTNTVNLPNASGDIHDWATSDAINFAANLVAGQNLENVYGIYITLKNTYNGVGDVLIDNLMVQVPEPATMSILALGGLLLRKRK
jgi:hypothetical protein